MDKSADRLVNDIIHNLLNEEEKAFLRTIVREVNRFPFISRNRNALVREKEMTRHYERMSIKLDQVEETKNPALIMGVEYTLLDRDKKTLTQLAKRFGMDRFLKGDMTTNQKCRRAVGGALEALEYQAKYPTQFHEITNVACPRRHFDSHNLPLDAVRDAARTQANALRNDMKGLIQTDQERKRRDFLGKRHQNMITSEAVYKTIQMDAKSPRDGSHGLF